MRERNANFWKCEGWSVIIASTSWGRERERESSVCQYRLESYKWLSCAVEVVDWCAVKLSLTVAL